jgi:hypothetical protein
VRFKERLRRRGGKNGLCLVAALAFATAHFLASDQDDENCDGNPLGFPAYHVEHAQQDGNANQDDQQAGHFVAEAAALLGFTTLLFFGRFHNLFLSVVGFELPDATSQS